MNQQNLINIIKVIIVVKNVLKSTHIILLMMKIIQYVINFVIIMKLINTNIVYKTVLLNLIIK